MTLVTLAVLWVWLCGATRMARILEKKSIYRLSPGNYMECICGWPLHLPRYYFKKWRGAKV